MKRQVLLIVMVVFGTVFLFVGCGSSESAQTGDTEETYVATEETTEEAVEEEYDNSWPSCHREILRDPEGFEGQTINCYGEIMTLVPYDDETMAMFVKNEEDMSEWIIIKYKEEQLDEKPIEGDYVTANCVFEKMYEQDGDATPMFIADEIDITPVN